MRERNGEYGQNKVIFGSSIAVSGRGCPESKRRCPATAAAS